MLPNAGNALNMNPCTASNELVHLSDQACLTAVSHCYVMGEQAPLTASQREKVVRYINELAEDFRLQCNTATLACNYFDRYLSSLTMHEIPAKEKVHHVQMIASTCLLISAKFYDCKMPPLSALVQVHGGRVTPGQFSALELAILAKLGWCLHVVHAASFLEPLKRLFCSLAWLRKANFRALYQVVGCLWDSGSKACEKRLQQLTMMRGELADARGLWLFPLF